jgi:hypothetical protein
VVTSLQEPGDGRVFAYPRHDPERCGVADTIQSETLTNSGGSSVTVSQANVSGSGFSVTGLSLPLTLTPGQSFTFGGCLCADFSRQRQREHLGRL